MGVPLSVPDEMAMLPSVMSKVKVVVALATNAGSVGACSIKNATAKATGTEKSFLLVI